MLFTKFFSAFLISPFNKYDAVYGSVTVIIILLLYIYVMAYIVLCGAHLCAAITHYRRKRGAAKSSLLRSGPSLSGRDGAKSGLAAVKKETRAQRAAASLRGWVRDRRFGGREFEKRWIDRLVRLRQSDAWQKFVTVVKNICSSQAFVIFLQISSSVIAPYISEFLSLKRFKFGPFMTCILYICRFLHDFI